MPSRLVWTARALAYVCAYAPSMSAPCARALSRGHILVSPAFARGHACSHVRMHACTHATAAGWGRAARGRKRKGGKPFPPGTQARNLKAQNPTPTNPYALPSQCNTDLRHLTQQPNKRNMPSINRKPYLCHLNPTCTARPTACTGHAIPWDMQSNPQRSISIEALKESTHDTTHATTHDTSDRYNT